MSHVMETRPNPHGQTFTGTFRGPYIYKLQRLRHTFRKQCTNYYNNTASIHTTGLSSIQQHLSAACHTYGGAARPALGLEPMELCLELCSSQC